MLGLKHSILVKGRAFTITDEGTSVELSMSDSQQVFTLQLARQ